MHGRSFLIAFVALAMSAASAQAQTPDIWSAAGQIDSPRDRAVAAALPDGGALLIGGWDGVTPWLDTVERYDATTNTWSAAAPMPTRRADAAAVTLPDGRVLVSGGIDFQASSGIPGLSQAQAQVFDPATGAWSSAGTAVQYRSRHGAVVLANGRVLVTGGPIGQISAFAETWDPATNRWNPTGPGATYREYPAVARLKDGRVIAAGGAFTRNLATAEIYSPANDRWTPLPDMRVPRVDAAAVTLRDGRVLVAGGFQYRYETTPPYTLHQDALSSAEIFDPATGTWSDAPDMAAAHGGGVNVVRLSDGRALVLGGGTDVTERFDPTTDTWTTLDVFSDDRDDVVSARLSDGSVLAVGGLDSGPSAERLFPSVLSPDSELDPDAEIGPTATPLPLIVDPPPLDVQTPGTNDLTTPAAQPSGNRADLDEAGAAGERARVAAGDVRGRVGRVAIKGKRVKGNTLAVTVRCTGGACSDRLVLRRNRTVVAARAFTARAGQTTTVRLQLRTRLPRRATTFKLELSKQKHVVKAALSR